MPDAPLARRDPQLPARYVVGTPASWARDTALFLAMLPWVAAGFLTVQAVQMLGTRVLAMIVAEAGLGVVLMSVLCALGGAGVGWGAPRLLESLRGQVPLPLLAVLFGTIASTIVFVAGVAALALTPSSLPMFLTPFLLAVAGITTTVMWLPYTMARVLGSSRTIVLAAGGAVALPVCWLVHLVLLWAL